MVKRHSLVFECLFYCPAIAFQKKNRYFDNWKNNHVRPTITGFNLIKQKKMKSNPYKM